MFPFFLTHQTTQCQRIGLQTSGRNCSPAVNAQTIATFPYPLQGLPNGVQFLRMAVDVGEGQIGQLIGGRGIGTIADAFFKFSVVLLPGIGEDAADETVELIGTPAQILFELGLIQRSRFVIHGFT